MKKILFFLISFLFYYFTANADLDREVSCTGLPDSTTCNQCFDGGYLYNFYTYPIGDYFSNRNSDKEFIMYQDNFTSTYYKNLQPNLAWNRPTETDWQSPSNITWYVGGSSGKKLFFIPPNTSNLKILETKPGKGITLLPGSNFTGATRNSPGIMVMYDMTFKTRSPVGNSGNVSPNFFTHRECVYYKPSWCGDGFLEPSKGEQCDIGILPGQPGYNANCSRTCTIDVSCDNGGVGGTLSGAITQTSSGLCMSGVTVGNFASSTVGLTTNYTWSCGGKTGGNCSASYTSTPGTGGGGGSGGGSGGGGGGGGGGGSGGGSGGGGGVCGNGYLESGESCESHSWVYESRTCSGPNNTSYECGSNVLKPIAQPAGIPCRANCTYCGDGNLDNYTITREECDFGNRSWPSWCKRNCDIDENTTPGGALIGGQSSFPGGGNITLFPSGNLLIGDSMSVFGNLLSSNPYIENNSTSDIYIDKPICIYRQDASYPVLEGSSICTSSVIGYLAKMGGKKQISISEDRFLGQTEYLPTNTTYGDTKLITTLQGFQNVDTFLKSTLNVRVAKPTLNTIGGGASLINGSNLSDINRLSMSFGPLNPNVNKNLILTSIGVNPLSSYVKQDSSYNILTKSKTQGDNDLNGLRNISSLQQAKNIDYLPNESFNGFGNVFINNGNVSISSQNISGGNKTYIIENGDLTIKGDIKSNDNILFVVKNGNIIIKNDVKNIDAIIINIGGEIKGDSQNTLNRLFINGAIYGKVDDLLSKRVYIKDRGEYIDVGTNVNFTSKIFDSPPPMLSKFLGEYLKVEKIAK